jgi:hypothetical protein
MSKELKALIPTNERLHVYKRGEGGSVGYCADYSTNELNGFGTIEAFLVKYAVPKWDYGEYHLFSQKDGSGLNPVGKVTLVKPIEQAVVKTEMAKLKDLMEAQEKMSSNAKNEGANVFEGMAKMMGTMKDLQSSDGKSPDLMSMMMLMQMMQKPEPKGPDMVTQAIVKSLENIEARLAAPPAPAPMPMLPPPAPAPDPLASLGPMLAGMMDTMSKMIEVSTRRDPPPPPPAQRDVLGELVQMKTLFTPKDDGFGPKEIIGLLPTLKELVAPSQGGPQTLDDQLTELRATRNALRQLEHDFGPQKEQSGFWDNIAPLLGALLGRQGMAQDVAAGISQATQAAPQQLPPNAQPEQPDEDAVQIPVGFKPFAEKINTEEDIGQKIGALIMGMQFLVQHDAFRPSVMAIFDRLKVNDKDKGLALVDAFIAAFVEAGVLEPGPSEQLFEGLQVHWDVIREKMGFQAPKPVVTPAPEPPAETPAPAAEPTQGTAEIVAEVVEEGDEESEVELNDEEYEQALKQQEADDAKKAEAAVQA